MDTEAFIQLIFRVRESMDNQDWFYLDTPEETREMMDTGVMSLWIAEMGGELAGALSILRPGLAEFNYGYDLGFSREELLQVVNMDTAAVSPQYRGNGIQRKLMETAEMELRREGSHILLCTIHPDNRFSLQNAQSQGYAIVKRLEKYGSVRYILRKDI